MGAAMGCIVTAIPPDMCISSGEKYSHWAIIHTDWGICKLLIPADLNRDVTVQVNMFGGAAEEVVFKGERTADAEAFVKQVEKRLNKAMLIHAEAEKKLHVASGGRIQ